MPRNFRFPLLAFAVVAQAFSQTRNSPFRECEPFW